MSLVGTLRRSSVVAFGELRMSGRGASVGEGTQLCFVRGHDGLVVAQLAGDGERADAERAHVAEGHGGGMG